MFAYPSVDQEGVMELTTTEGLYKEMMMNVCVHFIKAGEKKEFYSNEEEMALLLIKGDITYQWENENVQSIRDNFIKEGPYCLHVSKEHKIIIEASTDSELLVQATQNKETFASKLYTPVDCEDVISGEGLCDNTAVRIVRTIFDYHNAPYSNMVMGEVLTRQGGWSSYTPHQHPQPEVYYYRYERPEGFGACFIGEEAHKITDKSFCAIPGGLTHPQVTAPGFEMYYCWMIRHFEGNPWTDRIDDPRYLWLTQK